MRITRMEPKIILLSFIFSLYNTGSFAQNDTDYNDPTQHKNWRLLNQDNCGRSAQYRIIGGSDAELGQFPWVVRLAFRQKYYDDDMMKCGGTIINSKYILTAGHCFKALEKLAYIRVGELDEGTDPDCDEDVCAPPYTDYEIETITVHPDYDNPRLYSNDITLVRVKGEIKFNDFVAPICLEYSHLLDKDYVDEQVIVAGWGIFDLDLDETAKVLQYVSMPVVSKAVCNHKLQSKTTITDTQICAGGIKGKDSCGGDSGGPLMKIEVLNQVPRYYLLGIVSFGTKRCAKTTLPAVYTRVARFLPWILDNIRP